MLSHQDIKLKGRKENLLKVVSGYLARVAKALVVSGLIAIFYPTNRKF